MAKRRKRKSFEPVARAVRKVFRESEKEASRILTAFLGYPVEVRRVRTKPKAGKAGDTVTEGQMEYRGRKSARNGYYRDLAESLQAPLPGPPLSDYEREE